MNFKYILLYFLSLMGLYILLIPKVKKLRKLIILAFITVMAVFASRPELSTAIANYLGIGRGADLLFYLSHLALLFIAFIYYLKFKEMDIRFAQLVRQNAIYESLQNMQFPSKHAEEKSGKQE